MQQLECESNSITCMSCLYVHVYGNKVIYLSIYLSTWIIPSFNVTVYLLPFLISSFWVTIMVVAIVYNFFEHTAGSLHTSNRIKCLFIQSFIQIFIHMNSMTSIPHGHLTIRSVH